MHRGIHKSVSYRLCIPSHCFAGGLENFSHHAVFSDALTLWSFIGIRSWRLYPCQPAFKYFVADPFCASHVTTWWLLFFFWGSKSKSSLVRCPCGFRLRKLAEDVGTTLIMLKSLALPECGARFLSYYMSCLFKRFLQEDLEDVLSWRRLFESFCGR